MNEVSADMWSLPADLHVITTNGDVNRRGEAVMGAGCAKEAKLRFPPLPRALGHHLRIHGNHLFLAPATITPGYQLVTFPVKGHWYDNASPTLITQSVGELLELVERLDAKSIVLPRIGAGNGKLSWGLVAPMLNRLDSRFTVVDYPSAARPEHPVRRVTDVTPQERKSRADPGRINPPSSDR